MRRSLALSFGIKVNTIDRAPANERTLRFRLWRLTLKATRRLPLAVRVWAANLIATVGRPPN